MARHRVGKSWVNVAHHSSDLVILPRLIVAFSRIVTVCQCPATFCASTCANACVSRRLHACTIPPLYEYIKTASLLSRVACYMATWVVFPAKGHASEPSRCVLMRGVGTAALLWVS